MAKYENIPKKYLNQFAKLNKVVYRGKFQEEIEEMLIENGKEAELVYLNEQFKFPANYISICKAESNFPDKSKTPEKFIDTLITEGVILSSQVNAEWQPTYTPEVKICAIKHEGNSIYIKLVEERFNSRRNGYGTIPSSYAHLTSLVIHFGEEELIELRCSAREAKKYSEYVMKLMGFATPYKWFLVPKLTKQAARQLCSLLSAGIASTHIALPSTVGSLKFNGKKGINLDIDNTFKSITTAIEGLGLPTNDTMDENCFYSYTDPKTNIVIEVTFEVNIKASYFKFTSAVPEIVVDHVLDTLVIVNNDDTLSIEEPLIQVQ
ncbi:hypothetical protein [Solibacillus cecembensis]|uniref:hypothetical protein n=1 Tax=Solibacillus cecembensis TaxID=459347 RepID=UPI003D06A63A